MLLTRYLVLILLSTIQGLYGQRNAGNTRLSIAFHSTSRYLTARYFLHATLSIEAYMFTNSQLQKAENRK